MFNRETAVLRGIVAPVAMLTDQFPLILVYLWDDAGSINGLLGIQSFGLLDPLQPRAAGFRKNY